MKIFIKNNKILLITILILLLAIVYSFIQYNVNYHNDLADYEKVMKYAVENSSPLLPKKPQKYDTYSLFSFTIVDGPLRFLMLVIPFLVMLSGVYIFYSKMKSGYFKNECMRRSYLKNMILNVLGSWKAVSIIIIYIVVIFLGAYLTSGTFDIQNTIEHFNYSLINRRYLDTLPLYFIIYIVNLILLGIYYVNITLIVAKKNSNLFVTLVQSYLIFIAIAIIMEVFVGNALEIIFPILRSKYNLVNSLSIFNFWVYDNVMSLSFMFLYAFTLFLISTIIVFFKYRKKESVMLEIDK